jgi:hypothetical protein
MSHIWPLDVINQYRKVGVNRIRPFACLLLMPFEKRFNTISDTIKECFNEVFFKQPDILGVVLADQPTIINRLDWVISSGVIPTEIWEEILKADLIFCETTGYNPNVMFESGVASALKQLPQVVFLRDHFFTQQPPFDIASIRYTEYELTSDGIPKFKEKVKKLIIDAFKLFPDANIDSPLISFPADINFQGNHDDLRIYTPPFSHRLVVENALEFGSISFAESWASLGYAHIQYFDLEFVATFKNLFENPLDENAWIGVGLRSQHFYPIFGHLLYLKQNGSIFITQPNEIAPTYYTDELLREPTVIDKMAFHHFHVRFTPKTLLLSIDNFSTQKEINKMPKVLGPGLIRFQSSLSRMAIKDIRASEI